MPVWQTNSYEFSGKCLFCLRLAEKQNVYHFSGLEKRKQFHIEVLYGFFRELLWERYIIISDFDCWKFIFDTFFSHEIRNQFQITRNKVIIGFCEHFDSSSMQIINFLKIFEGSFLEFEEKPLQFSFGGSITSKESRLNAKRERL